MWRFNSRTGELLHDAEHIAYGSSGHGEGRNNPSILPTRKEAPIPTGMYTIGPPEATTMHGPFALPLLPNKSTETYARAGLYICGDFHPDAGVILARWVREEIAASGDDLLQVWFDKPVMPDIAAYL